MFRSIVDTGVHLAQILSSFLIVISSQCNNQWFELRKLSNLQLRNIKRMWTVSNTDPGTSRNWLYLNTRIIYWSLCTRWRQITISYCAFAINYCPKNNIILVLQRNLKDFAKHARVFCILFVVKILLCNMNTGIF